MLKLLKTSKPKIKQKIFMKESAWIISDTYFGSCMITSCRLSLDSGESIKSAFDPFFEFERLFGGILVFGILLGTKVILSFSGVV